MNSERLTTSETSPSLRQRILKEVEDLRLTHESEDSLMKEAAAVLRKEKQFDTYQELFDKAWNLHEWIEKTLQDLSEDDGSRSYTTYDEEVLGQVEEKDKEFRAIKDEVVKVLTNLGYVEAEVDESTVLSAETEAPLPVEKVAPVAEPEPTPEPEAPVNVSSSEAQEKNSSQIERLTEMYKNADKGAFARNPGEEIAKTKPYKTIRTEIRSVLTNARFNEDRVKIFMKEAVDRVGFDVRRLFIKQSETNDLKERELLRSQIDQKYQELLEAVAGFLQTEKVDEAEGIVDSELPTEGLDTLEASLKAAVLEFEAIKQSGEYDEENSLFKEAALVVERLQSYTETDSVRASHDKERYLRKLQGALVALKALTEDITPETPALEVPLVAEEASEKAITETEALLVPGEEVSTQPAAEALPKTPETPTVEEGAGRKTNEALFNAKNEYREKQQAYKAALSDFYEQQKSNNSIRSRVGGAIKKIVGLGVNPELPPALLAMQNEYKALRAVYAESLDKALLERASREGNNEYSLASDKSKIAFGKKFILKPNQELIAMQQTAVLSPEMKARLGRTMELMAKHKWAARIGIVTAAGVVGGLSGGAGLMLAGAAFQASKMALSAGAGAAAGYGANRLTQLGVDKASANFDTTSKEFTLADLDAFETELLKAQSDVASAKTKQKIATVGAAVLAGGATGYGLGYASPLSYSGEEVSGPASPEEPTVIDVESEAIIKEAVPQDGLSDEAVRRAVESDVVAETKPAKPEMITETLPEFKIKPFTMPFYGTTGNLQYETVISGIKIDGAFTAGELPQATRLELEKHIKLSMDDALHAHPNMSEAKLEAEVLAKVQAKFGNAPWYASAGITKIDIEGMSLQPYTLGTVSGVEAPEKISGSYVVQKGDTLSEITEKRFAGLLKNIPPNKQGVILDELFRNIQADADLRGSLGIKSGDVDLIYAGEKVNLDGVEAELTRLVERQQILENFRTSGPLSVEADAGVKNVPITVVEKPVSGGVEITTDTGRVYTEARPTSVDVTADSGRVYKEAIPTPVPKPVELVAPRPYALNGQFAEHPTYKEYINKAFGSMKTFEVAVEKAVQNFDNNTYDVFERSGFFGGAQYESPYRFLGDMTLQEVTEFETQPNEEIRSFMKENNIKYDTYLAWLDQIDAMVQTLPNEADTKVSDLLARYVAETQVPKVNPLIKKP